MLTDQQCKAAKKAASDYKLGDDRGLYLLVKKTGYKVWCLKYRFGGKEKRLTIGPYPEISLREARDRRDDSRRLLRDGRDPGEEKRQAHAERKVGVSADRTFEAIARSWHAMQTAGWKPKHAADVLHSLADAAFPAFGKKDIAAVTPTDVRQVLQAIQARGAIEAAHRLRSRVTSVYRFAIANGLAETDPAASLSAVLRPIVKRRHPALLKLREARAFIQAMEAEPAHPTTLVASRLLALTAARPGMIRFAEIGEFEGLDTDHPVWRVPAAKMKLVREEAEQEAFEFVLPLSTQAVATVKVAASFAGRRKYLFPSVRHSHRPFSENALNANYRRVPGFAGKMVPHGWRSSFSTIMNERAVDLDRPGDRAIIDLMLAHRPPGVEGIYNRAAYMERRRAIAQEWADLLLEGMPPPETLLTGPRKR